MFTIRIPALSSQMQSNLLGLAGLLGVAIALGGVSGNWWVTMLAASAMMVGLSYVSQLHIRAAAAAAAAATAEAELPPAPPVRAAA